MSTGIGTDDGNMAKIGMSKPLRWLLAGSLALNVVALGVVGGMALRHLSTQPSVMRAAGPVPGFGPWGGVLDRDDSRALREAFRASGHDFRADFTAERADLLALAEVLSAPDLDLQAYDRLIGRIDERSLKRMELGASLIRAHVGKLSHADRLALAERMRQMGERRGGKGKPREEHHD